MTKVSRPIARLRHSKYLPGSYYSDYVDRDFGTFIIDNVKLCVIDDDRGHDGFYQTLYKIDL
ncbi:Leukocyte receptor cluster member 9 [Caligus rogercresseyi]|nr:Leukocyte receptor cluster member 9 [Caligus rogercresseyi]